MGKGDPDGGRPRVEIDMKMLANLCRIQATAEECAGVLDCSVDTIDRRLKEEGHGGFADFFEKHSAEGRASLRRQQFKTAEAGNATMQIWLGKQWLGQTDKVVNEHTGKVQTEDVTPLDRIRSRLSSLATAGSAESDTGGSD